MGSGEFSYVQQNESPWQLHVKFTSQTNYSKPVNTQYYKIRTLDTHATCNEMG